MTVRKERTRYRLGLRVTALAILLTMALAAAVQNPMKAYAYYPSVSSQPCGNGLTWELSSTRELIVKGAGSMYDWENSPWLESPMLGIKNYYGGVDKVTFQGYVFSIGNHAFHYCGMQSVTVPGTVTSLGEWSFAGNAPLREVSLPATLRRIGDYAFAGCDSLSQITIPRSVEHIGEGVFNNTGLLNIFVDSHNASYADQDGVLFSKDYSVLLAYPRAKGWRASNGIYDIPDTVTTIGTAAFFNQQLKGVRIPKSVVSIEDAAFEFSTNQYRNQMTDVYYQGTESDWKNITIGSYNDVLRNATIHYNAVEEEEETADLVSLSVKRAPDKTTYYVCSEERIDAAGLVLKAVYSDGRTEEVTDGFTLGYASGTLNAYYAGPVTYTEPGTYLIPVTYQEKDTSFSIQVKDVSAVQVKKKPDKMIYHKTAGRSVAPDTTGMILNVTYEDGTVREVEKGFTHEPVALTNVGTQKITVTLRKKKADFYVKVDGAVDVMFRSTAYDEDTTHRFYYDESFFYGGSTVYHNDLAIMSLGLELSSFTPRHCDAVYTKTLTKKANGFCTRAENIRTLLNRLSFDDQRYYHYENALSDDSDKVAYAFASKTIMNDSGQTDTLVAVVVRGGEYGAEWASNFRVGNSGNHQGFQTAADDVYRSLTAYLNDIKGEAKGSIKLWITGFSRGAAVANLTAHMVNQNKLCQFSNLYAYTFATPNGYRTNKNHTTADYNIFNIVSANDIVPKLALPVWGFSKYGVTKVLPSCTYRPVANEFRDLTGEELKINGAYGAQQALTDFLYDVTLNTNGYCSLYEKAICDTLSDLYSHSESRSTVRTAKMMFGIANSAKSGTLKYAVAYGVGIAAGEGMAYWLTNTESDVKCGIKDIAHAHYPEHYLAWLETGGVAEINQGKPYAELNERLKKDIESYVNDRFNWSYELHYISCPVDVKVYDSSDHLVASIVDNRVVVDDLPCYVDGDTKCFYTCGDDYRVELTGSGAGTMDYTVQEFNRDSEVVRTVNHYDIALTKGKVYIEAVQDSDGFADNTYVLTTGQTSIQPAYDSAAAVGSRHQITVVNGVALCGSAYQKEHIALYASGVKGKRFSYWKSNAGSDIFDDAKAEVTAFVMPDRDVRIEAVYVDTPPLCITSQPVSVTRKDGDKVAFTVKATGDGLTYQWQLSDDKGNTWRDSSTKTARYTATLSQKNHTRYVRCVVADKYGKSVVSHAVYMKITSLNIVTQPVSVTRKDGEKVTFMVKANGPGLTYQWQLSDDKGKTWRDSSTKAAQYAATLSNKNNGRYLRCIVTDKYGNSVKSNAAYMKITSLKIVTQPKSMTAKEGEKATFSVAANGPGLTYQWQLSDDQGKTWRDSSTKKAVYSATLRYDNSGRMVRCIVTDKYGNSVRSDAVYMAIHSLRILAQPSSVTLLRGAAVSFRVVTAGEGLSFQWQLSDDKGKTWRNSSNKSAIYATTLTDKNSGRYVRCVVRDRYGAKVTSNAAYMKISSLKVTAQPADMTADNGARVTFTVKSVGPDPSFQWQLSDDQGLTWRNSSTKSATYSTTLSRANDGRYVRCVVTDKYGNSVMSRAACMAISSLRILTQPQSVTLKQGTAASFRVVTVGKGLTYQWQLSDDQGKTWRNSSVKTPAYTTTLTDKNNGRYVRCVVTDKYGNKVTSNAASMKVK